MLKLWWKSSSSQTKKWQQMLQGFFGQRKQTDEHSKGQ